MAAERIRPRDVAHMTSLSVRKVQELAADGRIPGARLVNGEWTFTKGEIRAWIKAEEDRNYRPPPIVVVPSARAKKDAAAERAAAHMISTESIIAAAQPWPQSDCGIYFLLVGGQIMYVGKSTNIVFRIATHTLMRTFDSWSWVPCAKRNLEALERAYINALMPPWNCDSITVKRRANG